MVSTMSEPEKPNPLTVALVPPDRADCAAAKMCDRRMAALGIALERIGRAYAEREIFP
jgi:hypothetical protein